MTDAELIQLLKTDHCHDDWGACSRSRSVAAIRIQNLLAEKDRLRDILHRIAYEPIGDRLASHADVLALIEREARTALEINV